MSSGDLVPREDPVDAVMCAYVGLLATRRPGDVTVYGDIDTGYIVTPTLPHDLVPAPPEPTPGVVHDAIATYTERRPALVESTARYLTQVTDLLDDAGINYLSVRGRTKTVASFAAKADRTLDGRRLYTDPLSEITDQIGLRVITYLRDDVATVADLLAEEMQLLEDRDLGLETASAGRWGYASRHLLVAADGEQQPASIQVRTILQHAWAQEAIVTRTNAELANSFGNLAQRTFSMITKNLDGAVPTAGEAEDDLALRTAELRRYL